LKATEQPMTPAPRPTSASSTCWACSPNSRRTCGGSVSFEGIGKAKAAGVYKGRPASIDAAQVRAMKAQGLGASEIAKALKIDRASVYRVLEAG